MRYAAAATFDVCRRRVVCVGGTFEEFGHWHGKHEEDEEEGEEGD